jgi:osmotically-inducible protein OsmY
MNINKWTALLVIAASPVALMATTETDQKIEDAAKDSYNYRTVLDEKVDVKSENGNVTLTGVVQDPAQREIAEDTVINLPGVLSVDNQVTVVPQAPKDSDGWIAFKIHSSLLVRANVSATATTVAVVNGAVTLTGTATSAAQKELTGVYVREIQGVKSVKNDLIVLDSTPRETVKDSMDDASITGQLKFELVSHSATSALKTKVETVEGVVTITGEAANAAEKGLVTELAEGIRGVKSVDNRMTIKP